MSERVPVVLIADDEPLVAQLYARAIAAIGLTPKVVGDGQSALAAIIESAPDLLITDINMPELDGLQVLTWLNARKVKKFPAIMLSGDDDVNVLRAGLAAGADDFIIKGMAFSIIQARTKFWLGTGLEGLPPHMRATALSALEATPDLRRPAARLNNLPARITQRVQMVMDDMLSAVPENFGNNRATLLRYLGVLDRVTELSIANDGLAQLRRLDIMADVTASIALHRPQFNAAQMFALLENLDAVIDRPTFEFARDSLHLLG
jgi:DNA-binding response OmpR family regulator